MFDRTKALEKATAKLQRQEATLKQTLAEIDHLEKNHPHLTLIIADVKRKRDRQAIALKTTEQVVALYSEMDAKKKR